MPAKKGNKYAVGNKGGGRIETYKAEYTNIAYNMCLLGATDKELAECFSVSEKTINNWKKTHKEFDSALKGGKIEADSRVSRRLYERAMGYEVKEDVIFQYQGKPVIVPTVKKYPPDPTSMIFWLKNRQRTRWRDKQDIEHSGAVNLITEEPRKPHNAGTNTPD
jgi:hypothetical protein